MISWLPGSCLSVSLHTCGKVCLLLPLCSREYSGVKNLTPEASAGLTVVRTSWHSFFTLHTAGSPGKCVLSQPFLPCQLSGPLSHHLREVRWSDTQSGCSDLSCPSGLQEHSFFLSDLKVICAHFFSFSESSLMLSFSLVTFKEEVASSLHTHVLVPLKPHPCPLGDGSLHSTWLNHGHASSQVSGHSREFCRGTLRWPWGMFGGDTGPLQLYYFSQVFFLAPKSTVVKPTCPL